MTPVTRVRLRVADYLGRESRARLELRAVLDEIESKLPETVIFGGMLREFALGNAREFASDIDLVTSSPRRDIEGIIAKHSPTRNRFGGFRFGCGRWRFDIWSFEDTWAFRQGVVNGKALHDLLKTTFFNLDAALFLLGPKQFSCSPEYEEGIVNRVLEINLADNPAPQKMALRTVRMVIGNGLGVGPRLARFVVAEVNTTELDWLGTLFVDSLERHVRKGEQEPFWFAPQKSVFP